MKTLLVTVHGIRTFGKWQERLEKLVRDNSEDEFAVYHRTYGYFSLFKFINPISRYLEVRRFREHLKELVKNEKPDRIVLVGHSFGTHVIGNAVRTLDESEDFRINLILLSGSVLPKRFPWFKLQPRVVDRVVNDCGINDWILAINAILPLGSGLAGRNGFDGVSSQNVKNRFFEFGHSGYFQKRSKSDADQNWFMSKYWLPLISDNADATSVDERGDSLWQGLTTWLVDQLANMKWLIPVLFCILGFVIVERAAINAVSSSSLEVSKNALLVITAQTRNQRLTVEKQFNESVEEFLELREYFPIGYGGIVSEDRFENFFPNEAHWAASISFFDEKQVHSEKIESLESDSFYEGVKSFGSNQNDMFSVNFASKSIEFSHSDILDEFAFQEPISIYAGEETFGQFTVAKRWNESFVSIKGYDDGKEYQVTLEGQEENLLQMSSDGSLLLTQEELMDEGNQLSFNTNLYDINSNELLFSIEGEVQSRTYYFGFSRDNQKVLVVRGISDDGEKADVVLEIYDVLGRGFSKNKNSSVQFEFPELKCRLDSECEIWRIKAANQQSSIYEYYGNEYYDENGTLYLSSGDDKKEYQNVFHIFFETEATGKFNGTVTILNNGKIIKRDYSGTTISISEFDLNLGSTELVEGKFQNGKTKYLLIQDTESDERGHKLISFERLEDGFTKHSDSIRVDLNLYSGLGKSKGGIVRLQNGVSVITDIHGNLRNLKDGEIILSTKCAYGQAKSHQLGDGNITLRSSGNGRYLGSANLGPGDGAYVPDPSISVEDLDNNDCNFHTIGSFDEADDFYFNNDGSILLVEWEGLINQVQAYDVASGRKLRTFNNAKITHDNEGGIWVVVYNSSGYRKLKIPDSLPDKMAANN